MIPIRKSILMLFAASTWLNTQGATVLFEDNFDDASVSSNKWTVLNGSGNGTPDYTVDWAFDYSNTSYTSNGVSFKIPAAPSGTNSTKGVKLTVNKNDDVADAAAVNIFTKGTTFTGNFRARFDMWINYNGGEYGGTGSTEFAIFGVNHTATQPVWAAPAGVLTQSDGVWFGVTGEAGAARDFRNYEGDPAGAPLEMTGSSGGFIDRDNSGTPEQEVIDVETDGPDFPLNLLFPRPPHETTGVPGKRWVQVELRQRDGVITWFINGYVIAEKTAQIWTQTQGEIMLGTMDIFASVANPKQDNFVIFDNFRVETLDGEPARLTLEATQASAAEPSTSGAFTITRSGDTSQPLTISLNVGGTAQNGKDYATLPLTTNLAAGATSLVIPITVLNDQLGEPTETVRVSLVGNPAQYEVFAPMVGKVEIADDGDVTLAGVAVLNAVADEGIPGEGAVFSVYRLGDTNTDLSVNIAFSGSAGSADYTAPASPVVIPAGATNALIHVETTADTLDDNNETIILTVQSGTGYTVSTNNSATATIRQPGTVLFSDDFETDDSANYKITFGAGNGIEDYRAGFGYDYSQSGIPASPHGSGTTKGLLLTVNKNDATANAAGVNVYPKDKTFSGNYLLKFDMYMTYDPSAAGTTENSSFGINHSGNLTNRYATAGSDGIWFGVESDGSAQGGRSYVMYMPTNTTSAPAFEAKPAAQFTSVFPAPPFEAAGAPSGQWVDVSIRQENNVVTWKINGNTIFQKPITTGATSGDIMLGYMDTFNSIGSTNNFVIYDNVKVYSLGGGGTQTNSITITGVHKSTDNLLQIDFTSPEGTFVDLQAADDVNGQYVTDSTAQFVYSTAGNHATIPIGSKPHRFFRLKSR